MLRDKKSDILTKRSKALWKKHRPYFKPEKKTRMLAKAKKMSLEELTSIHARNSIEKLRLHETNKLIWQVIRQKHNEVYGS